tara:strand:+ start:631 stop:903 length:273 start_codon:yes stop_codon:yes gene_type:complete
MKTLAERPLPVGKTGYYQFTEDPAWLAGDEITSVNVTCNGAAVGLTAISGPIMQVTLTGLAQGIHDVHWSYEISGGRSGCFTTQVRVVDC